MFGRGFSCTGGGGSRAEGRGRIWEIALGKVGHSPDRGWQGKNGEVEEFAGKRERDEMVGQEEEIVGGEIVGGGVVDVRGNGRGKIGKGKIWRFVEGLCGRGGR